MAVALFGASTICSLRSVSSLSPGIERKTSTERRRAKMEAKKQTRMTLTSKNTRKQNKHSVTQTIVCCSVFGKKKTFKYISMLSFLKEKKTVFVRNQKTDSNGCIDEWCLHEKLQSRVLPRSYLVTIMLQHEKTLTSQHTKINIKFTFVVSIVLGDCLYRRKAGVGRRRRGAF